MGDELGAGTDGVVRCPWPGTHDDYVAYHDHEWGRPVVDDMRLFEKVCLEGFQAGLSWLTILRKRENFRAAFAGFDPAAISLFDASDVERLLGDAGIVRHRGKIQSTINNAGRALDLAGEFGSLASYLWGFEPASQQRSTVRDIPSSTPGSTARGRARKRGGWSFVGPTTIYALMQAMGMVNDHLPGCAFHDVVERERSALVRPIPTGGPS